MDSLPTALDRVYASISRKPRPVAAPADAPPGSPAGSAEPWEALERLQTRFGLSSFERDVLVLLTGHSMESRFAAALGDAGAAPTFALALTALQNPHWSAISAARPLRYWQLLTVDAGRPLHGPLRLDERILAYLIG